jgi:hypothetical protein
MIARIFSITAMLLLVVSPTLAESVFSPLGIGTWVDSGSAYSTSVAGADLAHSDSIYFSIDNPATWRSYGMTKFTTSFGASKVYGADKVGEDVSDNYVFPNAAIALPIYKTLGLGFFYQSLTDHDYLVFRNDTYEIEEPVDTLDSYDILRRVQGSGGLARAGTRLAFKFTPTVSTGLGIDYYFGELEELVTIDFEQGAFSRSGRFIRHEMTGVGATLGFNVAPNDFFEFAFTARTPVYMNVSSSLTVQGGDSTGIDSEKFELPLALGFGATHEYGRLRTLAALRYEAWENSDHSFADETAFANSINAGLGFERLGLKEPLIPWYEIFTFRAGLRYQKHYVKAAGNTLNSYGASLGLGIPVANGRGMLDVALTWDMRGTVNDNEAREQIYGIQIGISSTERWFVRRQR